MLHFETVNLDTVPEIINTQGIYYLGCEEENTLFDAFGSIY